MAPGKGAYVRYTEHRDSLLSTTGLFRTAQNYRLDSEYGTFFVFCGEMGDCQ